MNMTISNAASCGKVNITTIQTHKTHRQVRAQHNVLHAQVQQGQEHGHSLLLKPRDGKSQRQTVDVSAKVLGQGKGNDDRAVRVVALAHVQHARQTDIGDCAKVVLVEAVLAAAKGPGRRRREKKERKGEKKEGSMMRKTCGENSLKSMRRK